MRELIQESSEETTAPTAPTSAPSIAAPTAPVATTALDKYTVDLTADARAGKIDPIRGRDSEIRQVIDILTRRRQNNPILVGDAGVGKTAIAEGFALRVAAGDVPLPLREISLRALDLGLLQAGAGVKGEFEERLKNVIDEVKTAPKPVILFIDEAHTMIGAGGQAGQGDAANLLKPALARGELRTIAATTWSEYKKYFEKDPALTRRFQLVKVEEPDEEGALDMLRGIAPHLEKHHRVRILDDAVRSSVALSHRYLSERRLPDKAIGVLDTAVRARRARAGGNARRGRGHRPPDPHRRDRARDPLARRRRRPIKGATKSDLEAATEGVPATSVRAFTSSGRKSASSSPRSASSKQTAATRRRNAARSTRCRATVRWCRSPSTRAPSPRSSPAGPASPSGACSPTRSAACSRSTSGWRERIVGQPQALEAICRRVSTSRAGLEDPSKPKGVFLLVGPTGVGKTETALTLAEELYGGERNLISFNMSEFQEPHSVATLKGAPPGYVGYGQGGVLTEAVRRRPWSAVLLDEIEKAHPGRGRSLLSGLRQGHPRRRRRRAGRLQAHRHPHDLERRRGRDPGVLPRAEREARSGRDRGSAAALAAPALPPGAPRAAGRSCRTTRCASGEVVAHRGAEAEGRSSSACARTTPPS